MGIYDLLCGHHMSDLIAGPGGKPTCGKCSKRASSDLAKRLSRPTAEATLSEIEYILADDMLRTQTPRQRIEAALARYHGRCLWTCRGVPCAHEYGHSGPHMYVEAF